MTTRNNEINVNDKSWIFGLVFICIVILIYGFIYSKNTVLDPMFLAGEYFVYALFIWGAFRVVFLKGRGGEVNSIVFVAIYITLVAGGLVAGQRNKYEAMAAVSSIQQKMSHLARVAANSTETSNYIESAVMQPSVARGEFGELERFMGEFIDRLVLQRKDYLLELEAIGWNSILDTKRIKNDTALSESRAIIQRAKDIVEKYEKNTVALIENTKLRIKALNASEAVKQNMLVGFEKGMEKSGKKIDEQWRLEKQVIQNFENMFLLLAASKAWVIKDGQILFYRDGELARFNSYIQAIQSISDRQEQIRTSTLVEANEKMESLKKAMRK